MLAQRVVSRGQVRPGLRIKVAERGRQAVAAVLSTCAAQRGSVSNFVREVGFVHQTMNLSPKRMANWVLASNHSRGGRFHSSAA